MNQKKTVYVVDDEPVVARALARLLRASGYTAEVFGSAREFMDSHKPGSGGCLVADLSMPGINGLDLKQWLDASGDPIPMIFVTGFDDLTDEERTILHGAVDLLKKPVNPAVLLATIQKALSHQRESRNS
jgi:FixJ family two-component response regulator